jgi:predicted short-subunit dehydrogenase-like oxidoreductase (DUF2520 family)
MMRIGFIGAGTVGTALAVSLNQRGYPVVAASSRSYASALKLASLVPGCQAFENPQDVSDTCDFIFVTTPDSAILPVVSALRWRSGQSVVHCSGADSREALRSAEESGTRTGGFHPLQTFASVEYAIAGFPGTTFGLEADGDLLVTLKQMAEDLDGCWVVLKAEDKVLYHASAVMTSNYLVTLVKSATDLWARFGVPREEAIRALLPLLQGTLNNIANIGLPGCLTGPISRGDAGTVYKHLAALEKDAPEVLSTYQELGLQTIPLAQAKGRVTPEEAARMRDTLKTRQLLQRVYRELGLETDPAAAIARKPAEDTTAAPKKTIKDC